MTMQENSNVEHLTIICGSGNRFPVPSATMTHDAFLCSSLLSRNKQFTETRLRIKRDAIIYAL
jgi:hypothetical protein